jgi:hypothetical protein
MGKRTYSVVATTDVPLVTTAETVVATLPGVTTDKAGQLIRITADYVITTGTNTTALTHRIRRDSLTGTIVGEVNAEQIEAAAGSTEAHDFYCEDSFAGEVAGQVYVLTVQQTAASANGSVLRSSIVAATD